jgi:serine/threonine protein kinase
MKNEKEIEIAEILEQNKSVLREFKNSFSSKYKIVSEIPMGMGQYGAVYHGYDLDRDIDIAIKIHHKGIAPEGSSRGWTISSVANHNQIANTYTIETFNHLQFKTCKAVISKFVPGVSLQKIWDKIEEIEFASQKFIQDDLAHTFFPSLLQVLSFCHSLKTGHGDLHQGNVMVFLTDIGKRYEHHAILIDFDNSSIQEGVVCSNEDEKIEKDVRSVKRLIESTLVDWTHFDAITLLLNEINDIKLLKFSWIKLMEIIDLSTTNSFNKNVIFTFLKSLIGIDVAKEHLMPILNATKLICNKCGKSEDYSWAHQDFDDAYQQYQALDELRLELTFIENAEIKERFYKSIFN